MTSKIEKVKIPFGGKEVSAHRLTVSSEIQIDLESAWEKVKKSATLEFIAKGKIKFTPTGGKFPETWKEGMTVTTKMGVYGFIPFGGLHTLYFSKIDDNNNILETVEKDSFAKVWKHKISMRPIGNRAISYEDEVVIYGGILTGFISRWARSFYRHRQKRWKLLAGHKM
ncbi:hypothetical protein [Zobellia uliginosa]|uniref:hypothetical protein n=1 Tax=Zobellia uliginosa TaxID=143224 RepID=UPI0026E1FD8F|nr:hypothetical protein [Zobellia uliginosa]MDO6518136.1 hypothetical protein [Zobellia uliginosa]